MYPAIFSSKIHYSFLTAGLLCVAGCASRSWDRHRGCDELACDGLSSSSFEPSTINVMPWPNEYHVEVLGNPAEPANVDRLNPPVISAPKESRVIAPEGFETDVEISPGDRLPSKPEATEPTPKDAEQKVLEEVKPSNDQSAAKLPPIEFPVSALDLTF